MKRPCLRVVHVVLGLDIGGLERVVVDLVRFRNRDLLELHVICLGDSGPLVERVAREGVPVRVLGTRSRAGALRPLLRELIALRPDVVHTHNARPHQLGAVARALGQAPVLIHTKHGRNTPNAWRSVLANRMASWFTDALVTVSENAASVARDIERVAPSKITVLRNGVDTQLFRPSAEIGKGQAPRAICVARLDPVKDHGTLLYATRRIADALPDLHLDLVGDGPSRQEIERLTSDLLLTDKVALLGARDDVQSLLSRAAVFLMTSTSEGISLTILEAMACGLPVVVTDVGGNREVVMHGETGLLVPPRDPVALAEAALTLLRDPSRRMAMGKAGRQRAEALFDVRTMVASYERLYLEKTGRGAASPSER